MRGRLQMKLTFVGILIWASQSFYVKDSHLTSTHFAPTQDLGVVSNMELDEASGMVASWRNPGSYWVINDSEDINRIFLVSQNGQGKVEFLIKGLRNRDWEALGRWQNKTGQTYIYIADIGDNASNQSVYAIHRFLEPSLKLSNPMTRVINGTQTVNFQLPDGSRDLECLLVDQISGDMFVISKREDRKHLYRIPAASFNNEDKLHQAEFIRELNFSVPTSDLTILKRLYYITGGDVAASNEEVIIRNYLEIYYWKKEKSETLADALRRKPQIVPSALEPQGEAVAFDRNGNGYSTISEVASFFSPAHIFYTPKK
jgi:hypothetical protein